MKRIAIVMAMMFGLLFASTQLGAPLGVPQAEARGAKKVRTVAGCKARFSKRSGKRKRCKACVRRGGKFKKRRGGWTCKR
jgi:hypothetical protein